MAINFDIKNVNEVFWAASEGFKKGRDPMGIENSSVATYRCLLPGITNQTRHIRYYSFYCWLLNEYDLEQKQRFKDLHQYNFIRRAELAMAFIMRERGINAIPGSDYFSKYDASKGCNLKSGADRNGQGEKYWAWPSGALGQYYAGSLAVMNLIKIIDSRFYDVDLGKKLAEAYRKSTPKVDREKFIKAVVDGYVSESLASDLASLAIDNIVKDSDEWKFLNDMLFGQDLNGSTMRHDSIGLFLEAINGKGIKYKGFPTHIYESHQLEEKSGAKFGWYFYYLCDVMHYAQESLLTLILDTAEKNNYIPMQPFLSHCVNEILTHLKSKTEEGKIKTLSDLLSSNDVAVPKQFKSLEDSIDERAYGEAAAKAILLMASIWSEVRNDYATFLKFENENKLDSQNGILTQALNLYVVKHLSEDFKTMILSLLRQVMHDHTITAYSKMGHSNINLCKFMIEDGCIVHVETMYPSLTTPRTQSLYDIMVDMGYIERLKM